MLLHMKLFTDGSVPLRMAEKRLTTFFAMEPQHQWWMNTLGNKWNLSLNICGVFHAWKLLHKSESVQQVFTLSSPAAWEEEKFVPSGFHTCSIMTIKPCMCFWPPPICIVGETKAVHFSITFQWLMSHAHSYLTVNWNDRMLNGARQCYQGRNLHSAVRVPWKACT